MHRAGLLQNVKQMEQKRQNSKRKRKLQREPSNCNQGSAIENLLQEVEAKKQAQLKKSQEVGEGLERINSPSNTQILASYLEASDLQNLAIMKQGQQEIIRKQTQRRFGKLKTISKEQDETARQFLYNEQGVNGEEEDKKMANLLYVKKHTKFKNGSFSSKQGSFVQDSSSQQKVQKYAVFISPQGQRYKFSYKSLFCLSRKSRMRKMAIKITINPIFEAFILICITSNSVSLSFYDYSLRKENNNHIIDILGFVFTFIFTIEALLKIISMGFIKSQYSYLRDSWNILDFTIVLAGLFELATMGQGLQLGVFKVLRVLRVLRPLRSIKQVPRMRNLVKALIGSIPELGNVIIFFSFIFMLFGIMGLQQFSGTLYGKCRTTQKPLNATFWPQVQEDDKICAKSGVYSYQCEKGFCGNWLEYEIDPYSVEVITTNHQIQYGISTFDNFLQAILGVFQVITFDNWTALMYNFMSGADALIAVPFFVCLVLFGSFFLVNLILAVIMQSFLAIHLAEVEEEKTEEEEKKEKQEAESVSEEKKEEQKQGINSIGNGQNGRVNLLGQVLAAAREKKAKESEVLQAQYDQVANLANTDKKIEKQKWLQKESNLLLQKIEKGLKEKFMAQKKLMYGIKNESEVLAQLHNKFEANLKRFKTNCQQNQGPIASINDIEHLKSGLQPSIISEKPAQSLVNSKEDQKFLVKFALDLQQEVKENQTKNQIFSQIGKKMLSVQKEAQKLRQVMEKGNQDLLFQQLEQRSKKSIIYQICLKIIFSVSFQVFIPFCIVLNSIILGFDKYPNDEGLIKMQEYFNVFFYDVFLLEMIVKMLGLGLKIYFKDNFNSFDCFIVFVSTIDIVIGQFNLTFIQGAKSITALRTFRLLRIFKLARQWKQFQNLLRTIAKTLIDIRDFSVLLLLFIFTACLLGREAFSYKVAFNQEMEPISWKEPNSMFPDSTFNSFLDSFQAVFIVLANDGWSSIFIEHYRAVNPISASIYFIFLILLGQYVMLNLFLAILLKNFDDDSLSQALLEKQDDKTQETVLEAIVQKCFKRNKFFKESRNLAEKSKKKSSLVLNQDIEDDKLTKTEEVRLKLQKLLKSNRFELTILIFILISSITLSFENPLNDPKGQKTKILFWLDLVLTLIFTVEMSLKIFAFGFLLEGKTSYLRSYENILDCIVVLFSLLSLFLSVGLNSLKILRLLRVLRPIRLIAKNEGLKISIQSLIMAFPQIMNVVLINILFFSTFSIIGVSLYKGMYYRCTAALEERIETKWSCINYGGTWVRMAHNFDEFAESFFSIFSISNTVGWAYTMYRSEEFTEEPGIINLDASNSFNTFFFIFFIIFGSFFITNLFVGVVISTYNREKEKLGKNYLLTENQKKWVEAKILLVGAKPKKRYKEPDSLIRHKFFKLAQDERFDYFITICIILNTIVLCFRWPLQPQLLTRTTETLNIIFGMIFLIEILIKLIAYGKRFQIDPWNIFDLLIVIGSIVGIILSQVSSFKRIGFTTTIIRSFRIGRLFKLFKRNRSLKVIFQTFLVSLPAIANVGSLLILLIYIYAVMGVFLFSENLLSGFLNENANFQTTGTAILTLFRAATGENWHEISYSLQRQRSITFQCQTNPDFENYMENGFQTVGCGHFWSSLLFFGSYILIVSLIFLNLFIAIILQSFEDTLTGTQKVFNQELKDKYVETWVFFIPDGENYLPIKYLPEFLLRLGEPLGWPQEFEDNPELQEYFLQNLKINLYNGARDVEFQELLEQLTLLMIVNQEMDRYLYGDESEEGEDESSANSSVDALEEEDEVEELQPIAKKFQKSMKLSVSVKPPVFKADSPVSVRPKQRELQSPNPRRSTLQYWEKQGLYKDQIVNEVMKAEDYKEAQIVKDLEKKRKMTINDGNLSIQDRLGLSPAVRVDRKGTRMSLKKIHKEKTQENSIKKKEITKNPTSINGMINLMPMFQSKTDDRQKQFQQNKTSSVQENLFQNELSEKVNQLEERKDSSSFSSSLQSSQQSSSVSEETKVYEEEKKQETPKANLRFQDEKLFDQSNGEPQTPGLKHKKVTNNQFHLEVQQQSQRQEEQKYLNSNSAGHSNTTQAIQRNLNLNSPMTVNQRLGESHQISPFFKPALKNNSQNRRSYNQSQVQHTLQVKPKQSQPIKPKNSKFQENALKMKEQIKKDLTKAQSIGGRRKMKRSINRKQEQSPLQKEQEMSEMDQVLKEAEEMLNQSSSSDSSVRIH